MAYILQKGINISVLCFLVATFSTFFFYSKKCYSDGWTIQKDKLMIINGFNFIHFNANNPLNGVGNDNIKVSGIQYNIYLEYGLLEDLTFGANMMLSDYIINANNTIFSKTLYESSGIDFLETFLRYKLISVDNFVLSAAGLLKLPGVYNQTALQLGFGPKNYEEEVRLEMGYTFSKSSYVYLNNTYHDFFTLSLGYRIRHTLPWNEFRIVANYMLFLTDYFIVSLKLQKFNYLYSNSLSFNNIFKALNFSTYGYSKIVASTIFKLDDNFFLEIGYQRILEYSFLGTNVANIDLNGLIINLWAFF